MRALIAGMLLAVAACGQTYEITGRATEPGVGGIGGIPIYLVRIDDRSAPAAQTVTDARGAFRFPLAGPGFYQVVPFRPGERSVTYYRVNYTGSDRPQINGANPRAEISFNFLRYGQITGLVLDEETRQPVRDFPISFYIREPEERDFRGPVLAPSSTDSEGRFLLTPARAAEYVIGSRPRRSQKEDPALPDPDPEAPDRGYSDAFWPGDARDLKSANPVLLPSGGAMDVGTILLHTVPQYKVRLSIPQGPCPEGESVRVSMYRRGVTAPVFQASVLRCGSETLLRGLDPGSYTLYAVSDWQGERDGADKAVWAVEPVTITDKNQDVKLNLERGITLEGRIILPEKVGVPARRLAIGSRPAGLIPGTRPPMEQFIEWTGDTTFRLTVHPSPQELSLPPLIGNLYVKEVRFNGAPVPDEVIPIGSSGGGTSLEIVMDDKVPQLNGTVLGWTPLTQVLLRTVTAGPIVGLRTIDDGPWANVSEAGQFTVRAVSPGEYYIVAISMTDLERLQSAEVFEKVLTGAQKITIAPGETKSVTVRLTVLGP